MCLLRILYLIKSRLAGVPANIVTHAQTDVFEFARLEKLPFTGRTHSIYNELIPAVTGHVERFLVHPLEVYEYWFLQVLHFELDRHPLLADPAVLAHGLVLLVELHPQATFVEGVHH